MVRKLLSIFKPINLLRITTVLGLLALGLSYLAPFVHPETIWFLPFFGLAYPIAICLNLLLLIIWGIMKSRWALYILLFILLGGNLHFRITAIALNSEEAPKTALKVLSYNVRLFDIYALKEDPSHANRDSIFAFLKREQADVVCMQEFYYQDHTVGFPSVDTFNTLLQAAHSHNRMSFSPGFRNYFGVAIYSKDPMITKGQVDFEENGPQTNNFCIFADIVRDQDTFRVYNAHLQSIKFQQDDYALFGDRAMTGNARSNIPILLKKLHRASCIRADQAKKVVEHMEQSPYPVILCGDFNAPPMSYTYNRFNNVFTDAFRNSSYGWGSTYAGKVPAGRIDYIFHSEKLESGDFQIQKGVFSDHRAISCRVWEK